MKKLKQLVVPEYTKMVVINCDLEKENTKF